jgi:hypothetical protein
MNDPSGGERTSLAERAQTSGGRSCFTGGRRRTHEFPRQRSTKSATQYHGHGRLIAVAGVTPAAELLPVRQMEKLMRIGGIVVSSLGAAVALLIVLPLGPMESASGQDSHHVTKAMVEGWMEELSNWGRWGADDELGTINLITPAKRLAAAKLVQKGVSVSLSHNVNKVKSAENSSPFEHKMVMTGINTPGQFCVDTYAVLYHGYAHSHLDAICHMFYNGNMYNGYSQKEVTETGAQKLSVLNMKIPFFIFRTDSF